MKRNTVIFVLFLFVGSTVSSAIVPFLFPVASAGARIVIGQFAAAGMATVINPSTTKTLNIPSSNKALKVSFGAVSSAASIALFALSSGFTDGSKSTCSVWSLPYPYIDVPSITAYYDAMALEPYYAQNGFTVKDEGWRIGLVDTQGNYNTYAYCRAWGAATVVPAADIMFDDFNTAPSQVKTDKLVSDLKSFSNTNPSDFDQIVQITSSASPLSPSDFSGVSGSVEVKADGQMYYNGVIQNGATWTDSAGTSHSASVSSSGQLMVDGLLPTGFTASNPTNPVNSTPDTPVPSGTGSATTNDLGSVVTALNDVKAQSSSDAAFVVGAINDLSTSNQSLKTDCDKFPDSAGCSGLGVASGGSSMVNDVIDLSTSFSPVDVGQSSVSSCPPPFSGSLQGQVFEFSYRPICNVMTGIKPVVLAIAWFISAMVFVGGVKQ